MESNICDNLKIFFQAQAHNEVASKESQVRALTEQIHQNEANLDRILKNIAVDTDSIKQLEEQLERGLDSFDLEHLLPILRHFLWF